MKSQTLLLAKNKRLVGLAVLATVVVLFLVIYFRFATLPLLW